MRFHIETLGCKVNTYESQYYAESLKKAGYIEVGKDDPCDICIINTCTVTNTAASKSRQKIHHAKKNNSNALIVLVGCYVQFIDEKQREALEADLIIGAKDKNKIVPLIDELIHEKHKMDQVKPIDQYFDFEAMPIHCFENMERAFLKVQDGCNQFCSYCAIPFARGRERSLSSDEVIKIAKELEEKGHQEIVLTGIHTGRYKDGDIDLACLLKLLLENTQNVYFRISSIEITEVSDELIELILKEPRICHHLHIPVQSACNETLQRMNRPYTIEEFKNRISKIRSQIPDVSISTDVITGFVMESDEEFETTYQNLKEIEFSFLHVFPYSKRDGTKAASMKGEVHGTIQKERTSKLLELSKELRQKDMERYPNITVLIERNEGNTYFGYTNQYHPARIESDTMLSGRILTSWDTIENGTYIVRKKA